MPITTDPNDSQLSQTRPDGQNVSYLVLSDEERAKGFVRPVRRSYKHVGISPNNPLLDLTDTQKAMFGDEYAKFEAYPENERGAIGRYWTQAEIDKIDKGCGTITSMSQPIAETYARSPHFYGATFCTGCQKHLPVAEFIWVDDGTVVGS